MVVEVGFKLEKEFLYYDQVLKEHGLDNCFNCLTHDIYYTNRSLDNLSENEMKCACVRLRIVNNNACKVQNISFFEELNNISFSTKISEIEQQLIDKGFYKIFDTKKKDHHYGNDSLNGRIQIQEIDDIGLVVYYDNSFYYNLPLTEQRNKLIDVLNSYGFDFKYSDLGLDKLRTLYYKEEMYSKNQNG